jgi:short-subunit dehydrogenase
MDLELRGKSVLITGASKGIGLACARGFAAEGANVHLAARNTAALEAAAADIRKKYKVDATVHTVDLGVTGNAVALGQKCGSVDVLVNNAGAIPQGSLTKLTDERWRKAWDLKVFGFFNLTREIYKGMCERGAGVIVNVIGAAGENHRSNYIAGTTGNASLIAFTRALGGESVDHGVRVVGVNPGRRPRALEGDPRPDVRDAAFQAHRRPVRSVGPRVLSRLGARFVHQRHGGDDRRRRFDTSSRLMPARNADERAAHGGWLTR